MFPETEPHRGQVGSAVPVHVLFLGQCRDLPPLGCPLGAESNSSTEKKFKDLTPKIITKVKSAKMRTIFIHSLGVYRAFSIAFKIPCLKINTMSKKAILQIQSFVAVQCQSVQSMRSVSSSVYFFVSLTQGWKNRSLTIKAAEIRLTVYVNSSSLALPSLLSRKLLIQQQHLVQTVRDTGNGLWGNPSTL